MAGHLTCQVSDTVLFSSVHGAGSVMAERGGRGVDLYPSGSAHPQGKQFVAD